MLRFSEADFTPDKLPRVIHRFTIMAGAPPPPPPSSSASSGGDRDADDDEEAEIVDDPYFNLPKITFHVVNEEEIEDLPIFLNSTTGKLR